MITIRLINKVNEEVYVKGGEMKPEANVEALQDLVKITNSEFRDVKSLTDLSTCVSKFWAKFLSIKPFHNGNSRTAKKIIEDMIYYFGYEKIRWTTIRKFDVHSYDQDGEELNKLFFSELKKNLY